MIENDRRSPPLYLSGVEHENARSLDITGIEGRDVSQSPARPNQARFSARKAFLRIHQLIGLFVGAIFVLIGLSGGLLAFREDISCLLAVLAGR